MKRMFLYFKYIQIYGILFDNIRMRSLEVSQLQLLRAIVVWQDSKTSEQNLPPRFSILNTSSWTSFPHPKQNLCSWGFNSTLHFGQLITTGSSVLSKWSRKRKTSFQDCFDAILLRIATSYRLYCSCSIYHQMVA